MILDRIPRLTGSDRCIDPDRRRFLVAGAALGGGFFVGWTSEVVAAPIDADVSSRPGSFAPDAFITIDRSGQVTITAHYVEMGQGTYTSIPMLIAEELEVDVQRVRLQHAPPNAKLYGNALLGGDQITGGSTAIRAAWEPMRRAGAVARTMLVQAAARRWNVEAADCRARQGEVTHAATGRRLAYGALVADAAVLPVPDPAAVPLKAIQDFKLIGTPARRLDLAGKVNGTAVYGIDAKVPGMKVATLAVSPAYGGRLGAIDEPKALAVKGVRQVVKLDDAVAVVADHMGAALKGLAALDPRWDDGPNAKLGTADIVKDMEAASAKPDAARARADGDFGRAFAAATTRVEATYQVPFLAHAALEPMNCTVHVRKDSCEVWVGTQVLARAQQAAAKVTGLPAEAVTVHNHLLGGGFGRRLEIDGVTRAVQIARHVDGPVKVVYTREEDIQHDMYRPYFYDKLAAGLDANGMPVAWRDRITGSSILARFLPPGFKDGWDGETVDGAVDPPYALQNVLVEYVRHEPFIPTAFWRGVGPTHNVFMVESFIDELAAAAHKDPVAYRRALLEGNPRSRGVLDLAASKAGWGSTLPAGMGRGVSVQFAFGTHMAQVAEVKVAPDGEVRVERVVCAVDCGVVVNPDTVRAQVESAIVFGISGVLWGEVTLKGGRIEQSNFHDYRVLRMNEMPAIEVHIVASREDPGGMGEPGTSALAPAVTNAVFAATGTAYESSRSPIRQRNRSLEDHLATTHRRAGGGAARRRVRKLPDRGDPPPSAALHAAADDPLERIAAPRCRIPRRAGFGSCRWARIRSMRASSSSGVRGNRWTFSTISSRTTGPGACSCAACAMPRARGVRVRLLVDDLYTTGADPMFKGLAPFPNVEVRLFNPFCCARATLAGRFAASLADVRRLNHRMHNKLLIADGAFAVMGGRNIADEYFARSRRGQFRRHGRPRGGQRRASARRVVRYLLEQSAGVPDCDHPRHAWRRGAGHLQRPRGRRGPDDVRGGAAARHARAATAGGRPRWRTAGAADRQSRRVCRPTRQGHGHIGGDGPLHERPDEHHGSRRAGQATGRHLLTLFRAWIGRRHLVLGPDEARRRGGRADELSRSERRSPDPHRLCALPQCAAARGVQLYELSPEALHREGWDAVPGLSHGRLHAKVAVLDDAMVYIGSMNLDPRSENTNTELGIVAQCPELANDVVRVIDAARSRSSYRLRFGSDGDRLEWVVMGDPHELVLTSEPEVSALSRFRNMLLEPFVPEQLL
jgi:CO/xanthine dehydrogenase Mo-binding subunit